MLLAVLLENHEVTLEAARTSQDMILLQQLQYFAVTRLSLAMEYYVLTHSSVGHSGINEESDRDCAFSTTATDCKPFCSHHWGGKLPLGGGQAGANRRKLTVQGRGILCLDKNIFRKLLFLSFPTSRWT